MSQAVHFSDLGLVNTREMFAGAVGGGYAIPAYNFNNLEQLQAIIVACVESRSPVILQLSKGAREYANATMLRYMAMGAVQMAKEMGADIPICLHLDHGDSFELCKSCIDNGFSSVMIDGSHLSFDENVALTKKVVDYAHQFDVKDCVIFRNVVNYCIKTYNYNLILKCSLCLFSVLKKTNPQKKVSIVSVTFGLCLMISHASSIAADQ